MDGIRPRLSQLLAAAVANAFVFFAFFFGTHMTPGLKRIPQITRTSCAFFLYLMFASYESAYLCFLSIRHE